MLLALIAAVVLLVLIGRRLRRYCHHCKGLGRVHRLGKPRDCRYCKGTGKSPRRRRKDQPVTRDPIHRTTDPIAAYRRKTTTLGGPTR
jgi:hypothetical protein